MDHIGMFVLGILSVVGGFELMRYSWPDTKYEDNCCDSVLDMQPARLGMTFGAVLILFGCFACYGGYCGWTMSHVLATVKDLAQEYLF